MRLPARLRSSRDLVGHGLERFTQGMIRAILHACQKHPATWLILRRSLSVSQCILRLGGSSPPSFAVGFEQTGLGFGPFFSILLRDLLDRVEAVSRLTRRGLPGPPHRPGLRMV